MPMSHNFQIPVSADLLPLPDDASHKFFIAFISSNDILTNQSWCPDVRAAMPHINIAFSTSDGPEVAIVEVGQRPEWKKLDNLYRTKWDVHNVPTLVRYQRVNGVVGETGRLVEDEILKEERLHDLINGGS